MRLGLRLQLLVLLGGVIVGASLGLYFAVTAFAEAAWHQLERGRATDLGQSVAAHVLTVESELEDGALLNLLSAEVQGGAVLAAFVFAGDSHLRAKAGSPEWLMSVKVPPAGTEPVELRLPAGHNREPTDADRVYAVTARSERATVVTLARAPRLSGMPALKQLLGLYLGVSAVLVLSIAYFALTSWIVAPTLRLANAASRVALGARTWTPLGRAPLELVELSQSLSTMTQNLVLEENALRSKVLEVEAAAAQLKAAQSSLIRSERLASVGRLSAGLAHEIGNPIAALMGLTELLLQGGLTEDEQKDFLNRMKRETSRIHRVVGDLLAFSRTGQRASIAGGAQASLHEVFLGLTRLLTPQRDFQDFAILGEIPPDFPALPIADHELTQALLNLVMNAKDACHGRGHVLISARATESALEISVHDTGPGVGVEDQAEIFEPFFTTKDVGKGTGLGLSVTRGLVEGSGGSIQLDPSAARGARFVMSWPLGLPN
jgi:two-component system, NtrC family, sensor kinase